MTFDKNPFVVQLISIKDGSNLIRVVLSFNRKLVVDVSMDTPSECFSEIDRLTKEFRNQLTKELHQQNPSTKFE